MNNNSSINDSTIKDYLLKSNQELIQFPNDTDYTTLIQSLISNFKNNSTTKACLMSSLTDLRRLLKYEQGLFLVLYDDLYDYLSIYLDPSSDYNLLLNGLLLSFEVFSLVTQYDQWVNKSLPRLLKISVCEPINNETYFAIHVTNQVLQKIVDNNFYNNVFAILVDYFANDDLLLAQKAAAIAYEIILMFDQTNRIRIIDWDYLLKKCCDMTIRQVNEKIIIKFIQSVKGLFNLNEWEEILATSDIRTLEKFQLIDDFEIRKVIQRKKQQSSAKQMDEEN